MIIWNGGKVIMIVLDGGKVTTNQRLKRVDQLLLVHINICRGEWQGHVVCLNIRLKCVRTLNIRQMLGCWDHQPAYESFQRVKTVGSCKETCSQWDLPSLVGSSSKSWCTSFHIRPLPMLSCIHSVWCPVPFELMEEPTETNNQLYERHFDGHTPKHKGNTKLPKIL